MILPDLVFKSLANQKWQYSGMDSIEHCNDQTHFKTYPHEISYIYNSRGFRDAEWPLTMSDLQKAIWCIGDSFTVGVGQPFEHIWPTVLSQRTKRRTINIGMDGASNDWIYRRALDIMRCIAPTDMVVMWSYTHRRESTQSNLSDHQRRIWASECSPAEDFARWINLSNNLYTANSRIAQITIPDFQAVPLIADLWRAIKGKDWPECPETLTDLQNLPTFILNEIKNLHRCYEELEQLLPSTQEHIPDLLADVIHIYSRLDWARDHHHFDILTSQWVVDQILQRSVDWKIARNAAL
jgi:hypothetical protein